MRKIVLFLTFVLLTATLAGATTVIENSADWQDVYSGMLYAALNNYDNKFLVSLKHSEVLSTQVSKDEKIIVIESESKPFAKDYESRLNDIGFDVETIKVNGGSRTALQLANLLDTNNFIIIDPTYGYSAVSVAPYAYLTKSYVLFADKDNIDSVVSFLNSKKPKNLLLFGDLDKEVYEKLSAFSPQVLNKGSRFKDNIEIAEKFRAATNAKQVVLTNGLFLEHEIVFSGKFNEPVVFIGRDNVPDYVLDYLKNSAYNFGVVIGNELMSSADIVKESTDMNMFIKFGKGTTAQASTFAKVEGLDIFPLPVIDLELAFVSLTYNKATKQLELVLKNNKDVKTYLKPSVGILVEGELVTTVSLDETTIIDGKETKGFVFDVDLTRYLDRNIEGDVFVPYGASKEELEYVLTAKVPLNLIEVDDPCSLEIMDLKYIKSVQRFIVTVDSNMACYADPMLIDLIVDDEPITIEMPGNTRVNGLADLKIKQRMTEVDLADNPEVRTRVYYGSREDVLVKFTEKMMPLRVFETEGDVTPAGGFLANVMGGRLTVPLLLLIILLLLLLLLWRRRKKRGKQRGAWR